MDDTRPTLLVVDDTVANINLLLAVLGRDYNVRVATSGAAALRSVEKVEPDLILLDILMPEMDGFEVCRRLKSDPRYQDIPIIFLSGLAEDADEARGLSLGAADYISRPFSLAIVKARVRNHLELKKHRDQLSSLVAQRTHQLAEANHRLKALEAAQHDYLRAISHELRTPMNGVLGIAELALEDVDEELKKEYMEIYQLSRNRLLTAVDSALLLAELQADNASIATISVDLGEIVADTLHSMQEAFSARDVALIAAQTQPGLVCANEALLRQSVKTMFEVALRMADRGTSVRPQFSEEEDRAVLRITLHGPVMSDELQCTFFNTFSADRAGSLVEGLGLAVPLAAHVVEAMGGSVDYHNCPDGSEIILKLRRAAA
jgi:CheY-like chemotaxis protein